MNTPSLVFEVTGIGTFRSRKRTMRDTFRILAERERILGGDGATLSERLRSAAGALAEVTVLVESAPEGWDVDKLDPLETADYERLYAVAGALRDAEARFREGAK